MYRIHWNLHIRLLGISHKNLLLSPRSLSNSRIQPHQTQVLYIPSTSSDCTEATGWLALDTDTSQDKFAGGVDTTSTQDVQQLLQGVRIPIACSPIDNTQFFRTAHESSLKMAYSDDDRDVIPPNVAPVIPPLPVIAGMTPEMQAFFQMQQVLAQQAQKAQQDVVLKAQETSERRQEKQR